MRNKWAHQEPFSSDDTDRALDSAARLLTAVSAPQADEINRAKLELRRLCTTNRRAPSRRRSAGTAIESQVTGSLKPWREVVTPHRDVASGRYQQAEFAADLWQVHLREGTDEYRDPAEFFRRTFLTEGLKELLVGAMRRLAGRAAIPSSSCRPISAAARRTRCWRCTTCSRAPRPARLLGVDALMADAGITALPTRCTASSWWGTRSRPGNPSMKPDGTVVKTLWGELAWQLGGKAGFDTSPSRRRAGTNPGDALASCWTSMARA